MVTHQFFPRFHTGVERLALNLTRQLALMGHECTIVTSAAHSSGRLDPYAYEGVRVRPLETPRVDLARPWVQERALTPRIRRLLEDERPDVVHVLHPMRLPQVFEAALGLGLPVVSHVADFVYLCARITMLRRDGTLCTSAHGGDACRDVCRIAAGSQRVGWGRWALASSHAVVSPCRFTTALYERNGFDTGHWHHVPWGVDYALHPSRLSAPSGDRLVIGFIGTLLEHKGAHIVIDALAALPGRDVEVRLYGGSFHEAAYGNALRARARDDPRIRFLGEYRHADLSRILSGLDAVVIPSLWHENLPTTGLNAIASGVPLIVSDVGGLLELIDDYGCGLDFSVGDAASLASLLDGLIEDPGPLREIRRRMQFPTGVEEEAWRIASLYARANAAADARKGQNQRW